jgi:hypothetical protein
MIFWTLAKGRVDFPDPDLDPDPGSASAIRSVEVEIRRKHVTCSHALPHHPPLIGESAQYPTLNLPLKKNATSAIPPLARVGFPTCAITLAGSTREAAHGGGVQARRAVYEGQRRDAAVRVLARCGAGAWSAWRVGGEDADV